MPFFEENAAKTQVDDDAQTSDTNVETVSQTDVKKDETKAYSDRLNKDREKIKTDLKLDIAKQAGYETWEDYNNHQIDSKIVDKGLDAEVVKPFLKDLIKSDPEYQEGIKYKKEKEAVESQIWATQEVKKLNEKYGTSINSIQELDAKVIELWNGGMTLEKAFASENTDKIVELAVKRNNISSGKEHLKGSIGGGSGAISKSLSNIEMDKFRRYNPTATDEDIQKFLDKNRSKK